MRLSGTKTSSTSRGLGNTLWDIAGSRPTLDLDFANNKSLVDNTTGQNLITFTRAAGPATYFNSSGILVNATTDEPRFDHNPTTGESLGLLVEESRTNLCAQSEDLSSNQANDNVSISTNQIAAPDGAVTADLVTSTLTGSSNTCWVQQITSIAASTATYTSSFFAKQGTSPSVTLNVAFSGGTYTQIFVRFDFSAKSISIGGGGAGSATAGYQQLQNGWFRIWAAFPNNNTGTTIAHRIYTRSEGATNVAGDSVYLWGRMIEAGSFPTSYIPTTAAAATRSADVAQITGTNFSSWYRQDEGTVLTLGIVPPGLANFPTLNNFSDGSANNNWSQYLHTSGYYGNVRTGNVSQGDPGRLQAPVVGSAYQIALALRQDDAMTAANGVLGAADNSLTMPTGLNDLRIGAARSGASVTNGTIRRITYWPQRLNNTTLQQITT